MAGMVTFGDAKKMLPTFARGLANSLDISILAVDAVRVEQLRNVVRQEITAWKAGDNPLSQKQAESLETWLKDTGR